MNEKRRRFSASFKAEVALEAIRGKRTINEIASERGIHPHQVVMWKKQAVESLNGAFADRRRPAGKEAEETSQLYEQIGRLKVELDWLKKVRRLTPARRVRWWSRGTRLAISRQCARLVCRARHHVLRRDSRRGAASGVSRYFQHRPGRAVHQWGVHETAGGERRPNQHGRTGPLF